MSSLLASGSNYSLKKNGPLLDETLRRHEVIETALLSFSRSPVILIRNCRYPINKKEPLPRQISTGDMGKVHSLGEGQTLIHLIDKSKDDLSVFTKWGGQELAGVQHPSPDKRGQRRNFLCILPSSRLFLSLSLTLLNVRNPYRREDCCYRSNSLYPSRSVTVRPRELINSKRQQNAKRGKQQMLGADAEANFDLFKHAYFSLSLIYASLPGALPPVHGDHHGQA